MHSGHGTASHTSAKSKESPAKLAKHLPFVLNDEPLEAISPTIVPNEEDAADEKTENSSDSDHLVDKPCTARAMDGSDDGMNECP